MCWSECAGLEFVEISPSIRVLFIFRGKNLILSPHFLAAGGHKGPRNRGENRLEPSKRIP